MVGSDRFGDLLTGAPGIRRSVLTRRLRTLEREGLVARSDGRYRLTPSGAELAQVCLALGAWGARWRESRPEHHDPYLALRTLAHLVDRAGLPQPRVVVRFDVTGGRGPRRYWLVPGATEREVCARPGPRRRRGGHLRARGVDRLALRAAAPRRGDARGHDRRHGAAVVGADARRVGRLSPFADVAPAR